MNENNYYYLGKITRKFSFKGELIIFLDTDTPSHYYGLKKIFLKVNNSYLPYFISKISKYKNNSIRVKFEDVKNESEAMELVNYCLLYTSPSPRDGIGSRMPSSA